MLAISAASSAETTTHILHDPITDILPMTLVATDVLPNPPVMTHNLPALMLPQLTPHYETPLTLSLAASLVEAPPPRLKRNIFATSSPSTTSPTPTTDVACLPSPSQTMTSMVLITSRMIPWSSRSNWKTMQSRKCLSTKTVSRHPILDAMVPYDEPIYGFSGEKVSIRGYIDLHTVFRDGTQTKTIPICFLVVDTPTSYNVLLGRPSLNTLGVVVSTPHLAMKFPSPSRDILTIHGDQRLARECYMASLRPQLPILQTKNIERPPDFHIALSGDDLDPRVGRDARLEPLDETLPLELPNGRTLKMGTGL